MNSTISLLHLGKKRELLEEVVGERISRLILIGLKSMKDNSVIENEE